MNNDSLPRQMSCLAWFCFPSLNLSMNRTGTFEQRTFHLKRRLNQKIQTLAHWTGTASAWERRELASGTGTHWKCCQGKGRNVCHSPLEGKVRHGDHRSSWELRNGETGVRVDGIELTEQNMRVGPSNSSVTATRALTLFCGWGCLRKQR